MCFFDAHRADDAMCTASFRKRIELEESTGFSTLTALSSFSEREQRQRQRDELLPLVVSGALRGVIGRPAHLYPTEPGPCVPRAEGGDGCQGPIARFRSDLRARRRVHQNHFAFKSSTSELPFLPGRSPFVLATLSTPNPVEENKGNHNE